MGIFRIWKKLCENNAQSFAIKEELGIVADQFGQPTNANDLAQAIMKIINSEKIIPGIFNFSNAGKISWFDFASKIKELSQSNVKLNPLETWQYPTPAKRPQNSTLNLEKIQNIYQSATNRLASKPCQNV